MPKYNDFDLDVQEIIIHEPLATILRTEGSCKQVCEDSTFAMCY